MTRCEETRGVRVATRRCDESRLEPRYSRPVARRTPESLDVWILAGLTLRRDRDPRLHHPRRRCCGHLRQRHDREPIEIGVHVLDRAETPIEPLTRSLALPTPAPPTPLHLLFPSRQRTPAPIELVPGIRNTASAKSNKLPSSECMARYARRRGSTHILCHLAIHHVTRVA